MNLSSFNLDLSHIDKKYLIIIVGAIMLLGIAALFLSFPQAQRPTSTSSTSSTRSTITNIPGQTNTTVSIQQVPTDGPVSPEQTALRFYNWYISHPNPLGSRAYEGNEYITDKYKKNLRLLVNDGTHVGNEVVFNCVGVVPPKQVLAQPAVYDGVERSYVVLKQEASDSRPLYQVDIHNVGGKWLINDIWCKL